MSRCVCVCLCVYEIVFAFMCVNGVNVVCVVRGSVYACVMVFICVCVCVCV